MNKTKPREITVVAVGDVHAGSGCAICLPENKRAGMGDYEASPLQLAMFSAWESLCKEWARPDILIGNGDLIEGQARKESGVGTWTTDLDDQVRCAAALLKMWKAKRVYLTNGTGYHVDSSGKPLEQKVGEKVGAEQYAEDIYSGEELFLTVGKWVFNAVHHISVGTGWYKTTPLARELVLALLNESDKYRADIFIRSHVHSFAGVEFARQRGYTLPAWQIQTRYMIRKSSWGMIPTLGALRFRVSEDEIKLDKRFFKFKEAKPKMFRYEESENP